MIFSFQKDKQYAITSSNQIPNEFFIVQLILMQWLLLAHIQAAPVCSVSDDRCKVCDEAIDAMHPQEHRAERIKKVEELATQGHQYAQAQLTAFYALGIGTEVNMAKVAEWTLKLAEGGVVYSQYQIGAMYLAGGGVERNEAEGMKWIKKAAIQGQSAAQYLMGDACLSGVGADKSPEQAVNWYRKSAAQSYILAFAALAKCHANGLVVDQDLVIAYQYYDIAFARGSIKEAGEERDLLAKKMTDEQIAKARAMGAEWQADSP